MQQEYILLTTGAAFAICVICQWLAWRVKLPAILFLLIAGLSAGPLFKLLDPEQLMGDLFFPFVSLSVAIILFEGSITLKFREILGLESVVRNMLTIGIIITWLVVAVATHLLVDVSWEIAFLFGSIIVVTGPTVIAPLLRAVRPNPAVANVLRWEGIVIDPIGASLAVLTYEFIIAESVQQAWGQTLLTFLAIVAIGLCLGAAAGYLLGLALRRHLIPEYLQNIASLAVIFFIFTLANYLQAESGLVSVTVLGIWLANMKGVELDEILQFKESLSLLLVSLLFLMLTARLDVEALQEVGWAVVIIFLVVQLVARPLSILLSSIGSQLTTPERYFLAWIAPRGIVAAAIASLFAIKLEQAGFSDARFLVPLTFTVIIGTVFLQSISALPLARFLKIAEPEPHGFLIIGTNEVARAIGTVLSDNSMQILFIEPDRERAKQARQEGLEVQHASPLLEPVDRRINLAGIGRLLALSPNESVNVATALRYRMELGKKNIFVIRSEGDKQEQAMGDIRFLSKTALLFDPSVTYHYLADQLESGATIDSKKLSQDYTYEQFKNDYEKETVELFYIDPKKRTRVVSNSDQNIDPEEDWTIIFLHKAERRSDT